MFSLLLTVVCRSFYLIRSEAAVELYDKDNKSGKIYLWPTFGRHSDLSGASMFTTTSTELHTTLRCSKDVKLCFKNKHFEALNKKVYKLDESNNFVELKYVRNMYYRITLLKCDSKVLFNVEHVHL